MAQTLKYKLKQQMKGIASNKLSSIMDKVIDLENKTYIAENQVREKQKFIKNSEEFDQLTHSETKILIKTTDNFAENIQRFEKQFNITWDKVQNKMVLFSIWISSITHF